MLLSGHLSDGAVGLDAVKRCGGIALVQDPDDALASEMPSRALESTMVDMCVPGSRHGDVLSDLVREMPGAALPPPSQLRLEVAIAAGEGIDTAKLGQIADPSP